MITKKQQSGPFHGNPVRTKQAPYAQAGSTHFAASFFSFAFFFFRSKILLTFFNRNRSSRSRSSIAFLMYFA